jgi:succinate dehydrogenase / fumarate reductase flavoprotein subunit
LFAAGESACVSVHGANRLGANSLLETIVFGKITGKAMVEFVKNGAGQNRPKSDPNDLAEIQQMLTTLKARPSAGAAKQAHIRNALNAIMDEDCGVFRTDEKLQKAWKGVMQAKADYARLAIDDKGETFNTDLMTAIELGNLILLAEATVKAALERTESRGAQFREDYPTRDDENFMVHITCHYDPKKGEVYLGRDAVRQTGNPQYVPVERKY